METEKIKTEYGFIEYFETDNVSFNLETILPKKRTPEFYLKRNYGYLIVIDGILNSPDGVMKEKDVVIIKPKQKFWVENQTDKEVKFLAVDIPKVEESDVVWLTEK